MPAKRKQGNNAKRLGKSLRADQTNAGVGRTRKSPVRPASGSDAGRALEPERGIVEIARLMGALRAEKIRFQLIGMSAAVLQGVPVTTIDIDLWIDLPTRQYM